MKTLLWLGLAVPLLIFPIMNSDAAPISSNNKPLNLDFRNIPVRDLINLVAKFSHQNVMINDSVKGEMSIQLQQVSWQQALDLILWSHGLSKRQMGKTLLIAPDSELIQHEQLEPLQSKIFFLHFAKASDLLSILQDRNNKVLSTKGTANADLRSNAIWLEEIPSQIPLVQNFIKSFDIPSKQVEIEARIVNIDSQAEEDLGLRFGLSRGHHLSGTLAGANQLSTGGGDLKDRLNFDLPATPNGVAPASMGLAMMKMANGFMLDLELSALESLGKGKIIASPKLLTENQQAAHIEAGEEIPYQEKTSSGATNVAFKKAVLSLIVTPQVISTNQILLTLKISQDKPSSREINGVPAINTREVETQVSVSNNQTLVLGGIFEESQQNQVQRVPFLSDIPLAGKLFQHQHIENAKRELLIFVTPKIIDTLSSPWKREPIMAKVPIYPSPEASPNRFPPTRE